MKHAPQLAQVVGGIMIGGGVGVIFGWAIACVIVGAAVLAGGAAAERARLTGKG